ncbi:MAG: Cna B-type domain-containing protein, partial [Lachnospiraceae bacterium]|nr:Cna B-type domain-containing protein [Lachnospiraceae bacterium]
VKEVTLNAENGWSATVTDLPMYQNHGQKVVYSWTEEVVTGYKLSKNVTEGNVTTLTNKLETVTISGQVKWEMNGYSKSLIPDGVNVLILEVGEQVDSIAVPRVDSETVWEYTSKELPKYTSGGDEITYTVGLESIPAGFGVKITGTEIVFTYQPVMTTIEGTVVWDLKDNEEDLIPDEVAVDIYDENSELVDQLTVTPDENGKWSFTSIELPKFREDGETEIAYKLESSVAGFETTVEGTTIKNTLKTVKVTGNVVWKMQGYDESLIPESVIVLVKKGDKGVDEIEVSGADWTFESRNLPMFEKDGTTVVTYTIEEVEFDGFDVDIDGTTITNTFIPELTTVSGNVVWELKGNVEELVPDQVEITIKDGEDTVKKVVASKIDFWSYSVTGLPKYRFDGITPITYTVEAEAVDGFSKAISGTKVTYTLETVDVTAEVIWDDDWNNDGFRPATVEVKLLANGEEIDAVSVSESTDWSYCWSNLPKKVGGKEVGYKVTEENVEKYTVKNRQKEDNPLAFMITYTHELEMTDISVQMIWDDSNNKEGFRPDGVIVSLLANGEEIATAELYDANEWKYTRTDYKYKDGKEIKYTVKETQVANYKAPVVEKISETGWAFTVTNSRDFEETEVKVTKVWDDSDNEEGFRPDSVTINLVKDGKVLESIELNAGNEWTYTWKKLQKYENGKAVSYTV